MRLFIFRLSPAFNIIGVVVPVLRVYGVLAALFISPVMVRAQVYQKAVAVGLRMIAPVEDVMCFKISVVPRKMFEACTQEALAFGLWKY